MNDSLKSLLVRPGLYCLCVIAAAWVCWLPFAPASGASTGDGGPPEGLTPTTNASLYGIGTYFGANGARTILWVIVGAVFAAALALKYSAWRPRGQAALVATMPLLPVVAVACTLVIFVVGGNQYLTPIVSFVLALLFWSLAADACSGFLTLEHCNETSSGELKYRSIQLVVRLDLASKLVNLTAAGANPANAVAPSGGAGGVGAPSEEAVAVMAAYEEALKQSEAINKALHAEENGNKQNEKKENEKQENGMKKGILGWVLATGYLNVWERLHRAEEALIEVLPEQTVIAGALDDELRLIGSQIESRDELLAKLRHAVAALDPCAIVFLKLSADEHKALQPLPNDPCLAQRRKVARSVLRLVRRAINEYRDARYEGLVVSRNRTWGTTIFTSLTAFMLLAIAIMMGASHLAIVAGATFFFVGATVALLGRLRGQAEEEKDVPDYGLSTARLCSTLVISGLAGIGGVVLAATLPFATNAFSPNEGERLPPSRMHATPTNGLTTATSVPAASLSGTNITSGTTNGAGDQTTFPANSEKKPKLPPLTDIFDLEKNLLGVLVAAVFGLTPQLLFSRLQQQAEKYKSEIKTSEASKGGG